VASEGRLDRRTGELWPVAAIDDASDQTGEAVDLDDRSRWLVVPPEGCDAAYRDDQLRRHGHRPTLGRAA
jgi:hypothetical protein